MLLPPKQCSCQTGTKQCLCRQKNAPVDRTMLMPTRRCPSRYRNAPVDYMGLGHPPRVLLSTKQAPVDIAPADDTRLGQPARLLCRQNTAPAEQHSSSRENAPRTASRIARVDKTCLLSINNGWNRLQDCPYRRNHAPVANANLQTWDLHTWRHGDLQTWDVQT